MRFIANKLAASGMPLRWVPYSFRSLSTCEAFLLADPHNFESVPPHLISREMCYWFVAQSDLSDCDLSAYMAGPAFGVAGHRPKINQIQQIKKWLKEAQTNLVFGNMTSFGNLGSPWLDQGVIKSMISRGAFGLIPEEKITLELCQMAVNKRPIDIVLCPEHTWPILIDQCPKNIAFIPEERLTEPLCLVALSKAIKMLDYIPESACTPSLMRHAVSLRTGRQLGEKENTAQILLAHEISLLAHEANATSIKPLPALLEIHLLEHIEKTEDKSGYELLIKQLGDAGTPRVLVDLFTKQNGVNVFDMPTAKLNVFRAFLYGNRSKMLISRKQTMLLKYYGSDLVAAVCETQDDWLVFKSVFGADLAIKHNPNMKRLFISDELMLE